MKIKTIAALILTTWLTIITPCFITFAATDAPHNASNNIDCGSCHGETILTHPFGALALTTSSALAVTEDHQDAHTHR